MGTKLQSKTYFPGYYSMRDVGNAGNGMWALYDEDKTLQKGQLNDSFLASSTMGRYVGYEKEQVRQTILKHESIFRDQLQELHRLYKRQRDLMNELGKSALQKKLPAETEKPSLYLSSGPSEDGSKISHVSDFYTVCSPFGRLPASGGITQAPLSITKGKSTCSKLSSEERSQLKGYEFLKPEDKKFQRKMFDLELPAEVYMNDEGKQQDERNCSGLEDNQSLSNKDEKLCSESVLNSVSNGHVLKSMLIEKNHGLADLNEPIRAEETSIRDPVNNAGAFIPLREHKRERNIFLASDSSSQICSKEYSQSCIAEKDRRSVLNSINKESHGNGNGSFYNSRAGKERCDDHIPLGDISDKHPSTIFRSLQVDPRKTSDTSEFSLSGHTNAAPQRKRTIFGVEISEGNQYTSISNSYTPSLHHLPQQNDAVASEPSRNAPWRMKSSSLTQNVVSSQDKPEFCTVSRFTERPPSSLVQMPEISGDKINNKMRSIPGSRFAASQQSALCFGSQSNVKQQGYLDLNSYVAAANNFQNKVVSQLGDTKMHFSDKQIKVNDNIYQMNLDSLQNRSRYFFNKTESTKGSFMDFTSPTCRHDYGNNGADDCDSKSSGKLLGFPIFNLPQMSKAFNSPVCPSTSTYNVSRADRNGVDNGEEKYSVADNGLSNYFTGLRHQIDLNLTLNEEETPSTPSVPIAVVMIASTEIDLEAPAVLESVTDVSVETDHLEKKINMCSELSLDDSSEQYEELSRAAAEAIVNISLSQMDVFDPSSQLPEASSPNGLLWLAEVISSCEGNGRETKVTTGSTNVDGAFDEETIPQGMDYFEFMTLKLEETKVDEYCYQPYVSEDCDDEDAKATSASKRPRKGQARRGRPRRDFQRDVLPGLVSLSRREVTEDLQTIEEIFKASGQPWHSSLSQRRAARNGRGRRRLESSAPPQTATAVCTSPVQQPTCRELEVEDRSLTGWGKRTRRLPRQRCSIGNHMVGLNC